MILFLLSFLFVFLSSYLITSVITSKKSILGFIYLFLIAFAQIVLTFEFLSLFKAIKPFCVLGINFLFFAGCAYLWVKKSKPIWKLNCHDFRNRLINSLKLDKSLIFLYVGFCAFIMVSVFLCLIMPITSADAQSYHVARSIYWVLQGSLNHFDVPDIRNLCLPINSEILYAWILLFIKKDVFLGFFSFVGYLLSIVSIYNILGFGGYCARKRLWVIFILSSFSSVIVQVSGTETDIIIAGLVLSSIFLFWTALKTDKNTPLFMSALAYALAIGTKTPALIMLPGVGLFLIGLCAYYKKYRTFTLFLFFSLINFILFASFNYILNFIQFSNIMGADNFIVVSKNYYGIKGAFANFIKYIFMAFDFTGFKWADYAGPHLLHFRSLILNFFHLKYVEDGIYTVPYVANKTLLEPIMGAGILGFLVYLPCLIFAFIKPILYVKNRKFPRKALFIFAFSALFIVNMIVISYVLAYMAFSVRFIMTFMMVSSPVLLYSYFSKKNPLRYIIIIFSLYYLLCVSTHLWPRPFFKIVKILVKHPSISYIREVATCRTYDKPKNYVDSVCLLNKKIIKNFKPGSRILVFISTSSSLYSLKTLEFLGYTVDTVTMEDASKIDFDKYSLVIIPNAEQIVTFIKDYNYRKNFYKIVGEQVIILKKDPVPCYYSKNTTIPNFNETVPYQVRCMMTDKFIDNKHLELIALAGVIEVADIPASNYFIIYRNKNVPLALKKNKR